MTIRVQGAFKGFARHCEACAIDIVTHIKIHEDWYRQSEVVAGAGGYTHRHRQQGDLISLFLFRIIRIRRAE
jgi:hypothetical protein